MSRRGFAAGLAGLGAGSLLLRADSDSAAGLLPLRTIAYNVLECFGYPVPPKGEPRRPAEDMMDRFAATLAQYKPDILTFSESPKEPISRGIAERLGMQCVYFPSGQYWPGTLITRLEVLESRNCPMRQGEHPAERPSPGLRGL